MRKEEIINNVRERLHISQLNTMQERVCEVAMAGSDLVLLSPTGTGKTLAVAIPLLATLRENVEDTQVIVLAPTRELVLQTADVLRRIAPKVRIVTLYGGHDSHDEQRSLTVTPSIVVATPGRLLDHHTRGTLNLTTVRHIIIDEFDKCLELGFEREMKRLLKAMRGLKRRWLTSATSLTVMPDFIGLSETVKHLDFTRQEGSPLQRVSQWIVSAPVKDKLSTLAQLLLSIGMSRVMVFVGYRDSVARVTDYLNSHDITAGSYHGALQQHEREMALWRFAAGATPVLVTTDLAARGLDIEAVDHVIHYHLPTTADVMTHRNGRTARVDNTGNVYYIVGPDEYLPEFVDHALHYNSVTQCNSIVPHVAMLHFSSGKREKVSRGDIVGFLVAQGGLNASEIGRIYVADHYAMATVPASNVASLVTVLNRAKLKGHKVKITLC